MLQLSATTTGDDLGSLLAQVIADAQQSALTQAAEQLRLMVSEQFETEGAAYGQRWEPRKDSGHHSGAARPLLLKSGRLKHSFLDPTHTDHVEAIEGNVLTWGTRVEYAHFHQSGTRWMPQREILTAEILEGILIEP